MSESTYLPPEIVASQRALSSMTNEALIAGAVDVVIALAYRLDQTPLDVLAMMAEAQGTVELQENWADLVLPELRLVLS